VKRCARLVPASVFAALLTAGPVASAGELIANRVAVHNFDHGYESALVTALDKIRSNQLDGALRELQQLVAVNPQFQLAQLMYADLLLAKSRPITDFGSMPGAAYQQLLALRDEARARWEHHRLPPPADRVPSALVQLSTDQQYAVVVDMSTSRLYLFENRNGVPHLVRDFYASIGKNGIGKDVEGDQKTPIGVYFVTGFIDPEKLPDLYGDGAFPIDYPNPWDQRHGRTGYGIWLHGTPSGTYSRPPRDSDGCVILSNRDLGALAPHLDPGRTPVVLAERIDWITPVEWRERRQRFSSFVEQWRVDWESRNAERYLGHYSPDYSGLGMDFAAWSEYKRRVNPSKNYIRVGIADSSMFLYPGENGLLVVTFEQDYYSDNYHRRFRKRQYWRMEGDGRWRIVYEGSVS
jgi:murein L,D-transpeptidase YafK